jgi:hypothetical protein
MRAIKKILNRLTAKDHWRIVDFVILVVVEDANSDSLADEKIVASAMRR